MDTLATTEEECDQDVHMQPLVSSTQHANTLEVCDFQKAGALHYPSLGCFNELQLSFQITFEDLGTRYPVESRSKYQHLTTLTNT